MAGVREITEGIRTGEQVENDIREQEQRICQFRDAGNDTIGSRGVGQVGMNADNYKIVLCVNWYFN